MAALEPEIELPEVVGVPSSVASALPPVTCKFGLKELPVLGLVLEVMVRMPLPCTTVTGLIWLPAMELIDGLKDTASVGFSFVRVCEAFEPDELKPMALPEVALALGFFLSLDAGVADEGDVRVGQIGFGIGQDQIDGDRPSHGRAIVDARRGPGPAKGERADAVFMDRVYGQSVGRQVGAVDEGIRHAGESIDAKRPTKSLVGPRLLL